MSLTPKDKELMAVGASLAAGCKPCTNYHFRKVRSLRASDEEIKQAMLDAIAVRDRAKQIMERHGFRLLGIKFGHAEEEEETTVGTCRITELVSVAAAFAVNCETSLRRHLNSARTLGVSDDEIQEAVELAKFIKGQADSLCCKVI